MVATNETRSYRVYLEDPHGIGSDTDDAKVNILRPILRKWAKICKRNIYISEHHGSRTEAKNSETAIFIRCDSFPYSGVEEGKEFSKMFEVENDYHYNNFYGFEYTGIGYPIYDNVTNEIIAEVVDSTIYILFDLLDDELEEDKICSILDQIMALYNQLDDQKIEEFLELRRKVQIVRGEHRRCNRWNGNTVRQKLLDLISENNHLNLPFKLYLFPHEVDLDRLDQNVLHIIFSDRSFDFFSYAGLKSTFENELFQIDCGVGQKFLIFSKLGHICDGEDENLLEQIKTVLVEYMPVISESNPVLIEQWLKTEQDKLSGKWVDTMARSIQQKIGKLSDKHRAITNEITSLQAELISKIREQTDLGRQVQRYKDEIQGDSARIMSEYENILKNPNVEFLDVCGDTIQVYTKHLYVELDEEGRKFDMGKFRITISMKNGKILIFNRTRTVAGVHHPHANSDGEVCWGNISAAIPEYIADNQYSVVIMLCIEFLKSSDPSDSWGSRVYDWPEIKKTRRSKNGRE